MSEREQHAGASGSRGNEAPLGVRREGVLWITECAWCGRVRSASGDWRVVSADARLMIDAERTHGICPSCARACESGAGRADAADD